MLSCCDHLYIGLITASEAPTWTQPSPEPTNDPSSALNALQRHELGHFPHNNQSNGEQDIRLRKNPKGIIIAIILGPSALDLHHLISDSQCSYQHGKPRVSGGRRGIITTRLMLHMGCFIDLV